MADYYAVLQKTLAGFAEPNEQLRTKLYERARVTIKRQLDGRTEPLDENAMIAEMQKLETAIADIEAEYSGDPLPKSEPTATKPLDAAPDPAPASTPEAPAEIPVQQAPSVPAEPLQKPAPVEEALPEFSSPAQTEISEPLVEVAPPAPAAAPDPITEALNDLNASSPESKVNEQVPAPQSPDEMPDLPIEIPVEPAVADALPELEIPPAPTPAATAEPAPQLDVPASTTTDAAPSAVASASPPVEPLPEFDFHNVDANNELFIPPAQGREAKPSNRRKFMRLILWLFLLLLIVGAATAAWINREPLIERLGLGEQIDDPQKPKPVKTISVKPEPAQPEPEADSTVVVPQPKREERLNEEGVEVAPTTTTPIIDNEITPAPDVTPESSGSSQATADNSNGSIRAILYEEGATSGTGVLDPGAVTWSVVQETPSPGAEEESAIRARVEIPDRKVVLVMTIKRNTDPALPASHLIELIFALPEEFSGGTVETVNRFVLKAGEQDRGDTLVAVPAAIADGIFLVALNNLTEAKAKNEDLLKTRNWIDIPIQYRTGRRALVTIEKGAAGQRIFEQVFAEWAEKG